MAVLNIRRLPDEVHARLRVRAAKAGRSMEGEARAILTAACMAERDDSDALSFTLSLPDWVDQMFGDNKPTDVGSPCSRRTAPGRRSMWAQRYA